MRKTLMCMLFCSLFASMVVAQSTLETKIAAATASLTCAEPTERDPVSLNATLVSHGDTSAIIVKVLLAPEWHIYQYVPATAPYVQLENVLKLPIGLEVAGKWAMSEPVPYLSDPGVMIHETQAWFVQKVTGKAAAGSVIKTGLYYQTCDHRQCLPPDERIIEVKL